MKKTIACLLCLVLLLSCVMPAMAAELSSLETSNSIEKTEVLSKRDAYSKTYILPDGSFQFVGYAEPIHYQDGTGSYVEINNKITDATKAEGYKYTNTSNAWHAYFSDDLSDNNAVMMTSEKYNIAFSFIGPTGVSSLTKATDLPLKDSRETLTAYHQALAADNRAVIYGNVVDNVDIAYTVQTGVLKEDIIIKAKQAPNSFKFRLNTNGLVLKESNDAVALFTTSGQEAFRFAPLYMEDANGKRSENVSLTYTSAKNGYELTITADTEFLNAADTVYPVVIDPSVMVTGETVTYDTCVDQEYPTSNYYLSENLWTGGALGTNAMRTYIKFDMPTSIPSAYITSAYLRLNKKEHLAPTIKAYRVTSNWSSSGITWNNKPSYSTSDVSGTSSQYIDTWYSLNVTTLVKDWISGTYSNYGFVLKEPSETNSAQKTKFYSSDAPSPNKPELVVNYSNLPASGAGIDSILGFGINTYTNCSLEDRAGKNLVQLLSYQIPTSNDALYYNSEAYPSRVLNANTADLFVYAGHAKRYGNYGLLHFYASSSTNPSHSRLDETDAVDPFELSSQNLRLKHKYVAMYTCNWLYWTTTTESTNAKSIMDIGCRQQLGFGTQMYLDSREGLYFGILLQDGNVPIKNAFFEAAQMYQKQSQSDVIAKAICWTPSVNDTFYSGNSGLAPGYANDPSDYSVYSSYVAHTGVTIP